MHSERKGGQYLNAQIRIFGGGDDFRSRFITIEALVILLLSFTATCCHR